MSRDLAPPDRSLRLITVTLAFACGATVANIYYAQPLLGLISTSLHVSESVATTVVTATQLGYLLGLLFLVPLGDLLENRAFASRTLLGTALALLVAGLAPDATLFIAVCVVVGISSTVCQVLVPLAAHFAPPDRRGHVVGQVMSGLLVGILLARTVSSLVASVASWRTIYVVSAVMMVGLSLALRQVLPQRRTDPNSSYGDLLRSVARLVKDEPVLRTRALCQALMFGAFTCYWTGIAYELVDAHGLSQRQIAVFALVGAAGAVSAPIAGRVGDRGHGQAGRVVMMVLGAVSLLLADLGASSVVALAVAAILLDLATQSHQVLGQRDIYALRDDARARITTVYMSTVFAGGTLSSAAAGWLHSRWGWSGVSLFAAALPCLAIVVWAHGTAREQRMRRSAGEPVEV